jgi:16S rRNA (adenine1518-N6/adenine1519-N6)-dimethyltransferase
MKHQARKRFGQNFLQDRQVIERIISVIDPKTDDLLVEIGPGQAALTHPLFFSGAELHLVELDRDLAARLTQQIDSWRSIWTANPDSATNPGSAAKEESRVQLHVADALKCDFEELLGGRPFRLIGNLPYNISTPLLFHLLQWPDLVRDMHFMLQREVVNRMAAEPGGKTWGKLSVMCQYQCQVTPLFSVPPTAFVPQPRVESTFVRLVPHKTAPVKIKTLKSLDTVVSKAFGQRRKTLRNSLRDTIDAQAIEAAGIDPGLRPEMLTMKQFALLSELVE